jgi:diguanylate cyclase (GGDEF)-like protein/PAS domain S-box-containing protein
VLDRIFGIDAAYPRDFAHWLALVAPDMQEEMDDYVTATFVRRADFEKEYRIVRAADGVERWVSGLGKIDYDDDGRPRRMVGTIRDISDEVRNTELLRLSASVFENVQQGVLITDAERRILKANAAFTRLTGYTQDEIVGRNPRLLQSGLQDQRFYETMWREIQGSGHWLGEIWNRKKSGEFIAGVLDINVVRNRHGEISHYVGLFTDITGLKNTQRELERMANFDALTGLPNRTLLTDRLQQAVVQAQRNEWLLAVCFLDLDEFKPINDRHGHETGDRLLIEVARRISETLRSGDTVARFGGDEFVLLLPQLEGEVELGQIMERILRTVAEPAIIDGRPIATTVSIGVTLFPDGDADPALLLRHADQAMYEAKQLGRNGFRIYRPGR